MKSFKKRALEGFAKHGVTEVKVGNKVIKTKEPTEEDHCEYCGQLPGFDDGCEICSNPNLMDDD